MPTNGIDICASHIVQQRITQLLKKRIGCKFIQIILENDFNPSRQPLLATPRPYSNDAISQPAVLHKTIFFSNRCSPIAWIINETTNLHDRANDNIKNNVVTDWNTIVRMFAFFH